MHIQEVDIIILCATWRHIPNGKSWIHTTNGIAYISMNVTPLISIGADQVSNIYYYSNPEAII